MEKTRRDGEKLLAAHEAQDAAAPDDLASDRIEDELDGSLDPDELSNDAEAPNGEPQALTRAELEVLGREAEELAQYRELAQEIPKR